MQKTEHKSLLLVLSRMFKLTDLEFLTNLPHLILTFHTFLVNKFISAGTPSNHASWQPV